MEKREEFLLTTLVYLDFLNYSYLAWFNDGQYFVEDLLPSQHVEYASHD